MHVAQRAPNVDLLFLALDHRLEGRIGTHFARAIDIDQLGLRALPVKGFRQVHRQAFAAAEAVTQTAQDLGRRRILQQRPQQRGNDHHPADTVPGQCLDKPRGTMLTDPVIRKNHRRHASQQRREQFGHMVDKVQRGFLAAHLVRAIRELLPAPLQAVQRAPLAALDAFGRATGAGGVDHIAQVLESHRRQVAGVLRNQRRLAGIQIQQRHGERRLRALGNHRLATAVRHHVRQATGRQCRVQRQVGHAEFPGGQRRGYKIKPRLQQQADYRAFAGVWRQVPGQLIGTAIERFIGQRLLTADQRGVLRCASGLLFKLTDQSGLIGLRGNGRRLSQRR
ncbi:hypothetical protein D3C85_717900 [compost metagenome]